MNESHRSVPVLLFGAPFQQPNIVFRTRFLAPDPVVAIDDGSSVTLWVSPLEEHRAREESTATSVRSTFEVDGPSLFEKAGSEAAYWPELVIAICKAHGLSRVAVDGGFPHLIAARLAENGIDVEVDMTLYQRERRIKTPQELVYLAEVETIGLEGLAHALDVLRQSEIVDGLLHFEGKPLTGTDLVRVVEAHFLSRDCLTTDSICCGGPESSDPHRLVSPVIRANLPIVLDLFPYHRATRYWGDLTRTVVVGTPPPEVVAMWDAVKEAQQRALDAVRPGVDAGAVHRICCDVFKSRGYGSVTKPYNEISSSARFIHGTGHGVGLEIHEFPRISDPHVLLEEGDVVTVEPGLYDPKFGGIRIEDLVVVTADGCRNLTDFTKSLSISDLPVDEYLQRAKQLA